MRGLRILVSAICSLALAIATARGETSPSITPRPQPDAPAAPDSTPSPATPPAPGGDLYAACMREFRTMTLAASATADLHERSRLLLARPECVVGMQPPPAPPAPGPRVPMVEVPFSYNQTLMTDGAAGITLLALAAVNKSDGGPQAVGVLSLGLYLLGGPGVHLSHGRGKAAIKSLALRVGLPLVAGVVGCGLDNGNNGEFGCAGGAGVGGLLGIAGAMVLDWKVLSRGRVAVPAAGLQVGLMPRRDGGFAVSVGRRF